MIRGISMRLPEEESTLCFDIFQEVPIQDFTWVINSNVTADMWYYIPPLPGMINGSAEDFKMYTGDLFGDFKSDSDDSKAISGKAFAALVAYPYYRLWCIEARAYSPDAIVQMYPNIETIETYEEYLRSRCELFLLCADAWDIQIYCKNQSYLESLHAAALQKGYEEVEWITDENDARTRMSIW